jgi:iron complex transport system substrate-binding protein
VNLRTSERQKLRIVSLAPSATSILCEIGARASLVGVTKWCCNVAPVAGLPKLGDCWHMKSVEEVAALRPSVVLGSVPFKTETVAALLAQAFAFLALNPRTLADIDADIRLLAGITRRGAQGERLIRRMHSVFRECAPKRKTRRLRVYAEAWPKPRISSPPWVAELIEICEAKSAVKPGQRVTDEEVAAAKPDVILLAWAATGEHARPSGAYSLSAWKDVPAIRNRQVHVVRDDLLNTPGPPLMEGARELARIFRAAEKTL